MDTVKIGKYIAGKRKALGMTQAQVAEKLGMSDKSVSKWERGICLPDVSVYMALCEILGISLNEFIAGEDIEPAEVVQKSEENLIQVTEDGEHRKRKLKKIIVLLAVFGSVMASQSYTRYSFSYYETMLCVWHETISWLYGRKMQDGLIFCANLSNFIYIPKYSSKFFLVRHDILMNAYSRGVIICVKL